MKCPINLDKIHCQNCYFIKEGLCDYPYPLNASYEGNKKITAELKEQNNGSGNKGTHP